MHKELVAVMNAIEMLRADVARLESTFCTSFGSSTNISTTQNTTTTKKLVQKSPDENSTEPWTCSEQYLEAPTEEFLAVRESLFDDLLSVKERTRRTWVSPVELQHLIERLHTYPESRLSPEDIRITITNWLETSISIGRGAPRYPRKMWDENKTHGVPYWQSNLDFGKEALLAKDSPQPLKRTKREAAMDDFKAEAKSRRSKSREAVAA